MNYYYPRSRIWLNKQTNTNNMKNKIIATLVAFGLVGSVSAIEIKDNLSVNGFIDGSINKIDQQTSGATLQIGVLMKSMLTFC